MSKVQTVEEYLKSGKKIKQCPADTKTKKEDMHESNIKEMYVSSLSQAARSGNRRRDRKAGLDDICHTKKGKVRSLFSGIPPSDITKSWVRERLLKGVCERSGIKFNFSIFKGIGRVDPFIPSLDRIDSSKGYSQSNCQVVVWIYNRAKGDGTDADVLFLAEQMVKYNNKVENDPIA